MCNCILLDARRLVAMLAFSSCTFLATFALPARAQQPSQEQPAVRVTADHAIEMYVSEDALQALYIRELDTRELGPIELRGGVFYNEDRDLIMLADALAEVGEVDRSRRLVARVGPRMYGAFLSQENQDIFGVGLGGELRYYLGRDRSTSVSLTAYYAPDILTFGQADNVKDVGVRLETELRDGTDIYVGFRSFEFDVLGSDREVDDNMHVGFRRTF
jgi:hypothetical protein